MTEKKNIKEWENPRDWEKRNASMLTVSIHPLTGDRVKVVWSDFSETECPTLEDAVNYLKSIERRYIIHDN